MENKKINVGIIGGSLNGWAAYSHLPALQMLKDKFELTAVSTTSQESSDAAASKYGVKHSFDNEYDLVNSPDVDLVMVAVKVPYHKHLVETAINAGKMVFCEWPLGNGTEEAIYLNNLAKEKSVKTFCGLQSGTLPDILFLRDFIAEGNLGEIFSSTVLGTGENWGTTLSSESLIYLLDPKNGGTMMDIPFAHTLYGFEFCLGKIDKLSSLLVTRNNEILVKDINKTVPQLSKDQIVLMGTLVNGTVMNLHYHGGATDGINLQWEIIGRKGKLLITSPTGNLQFGKLKIQLALDEEPLKDLEIPEKYRPNKGGAPGFDAALSRCEFYAYEVMAKDILNGTNIYPSFKNAVKHHQLLDLIKQSSDQESKLLNS